MTILTTYRRNEPDTIRGESITITTTCSSFDKLEIDRLQEMCKGVYGVGTISDVKLSEVKGMTDNTWVLEMIRDRDCRTDAERDVMNMAINSLKAEELRKKNTLDGLSLIEKLEKHKVSPDYIYDYFAYNKAINDVICLIKEYLEVSDGT